MQNEIAIVGLNHRSAPIEVRESVAFENSYVRVQLSAVCATIRQSVKG